MLALPNEILGIIAKYVRDLPFKPKTTCDYSFYRPRQSNPLWALTLTSRGLNSVATPILYKSINIDTMNAGQLLLRTLYENPTLGLYCTSFGLANGFKQFKLSLPVEDRHLYERNTEASELLAGYMRTTRTDRRKSRYIDRGREIQEKVVKYFGCYSDCGRKSTRVAQIRSSKNEHGPQEPWLWAWTILYYLPNLQHLESTVEVNADLPLHLLYDWFGTTRSFSYSAPFCFSNLTSFTRSTRASNDTVECGELIYILLTAPKIREVNLKDCSLLLPDVLLQQPRMKEFAGAPSNLQTLNLENCFTTGYSLNTLFQRTPNLNKLSLSLRNDSDRKVGAGKVLLKKCYKGLTSLSDLEDLSITVCKPVCLRESFDWLGDLSQFKSLRRVKLDWQFWTFLESHLGDCSADYLPDQLERLVIVTRPTHSPVCILDHLEDYNQGTYRQPYARKGYEKSLHGHEVPTFVAYSSLTIGNLQI